MKLIYETELLYRKICEYEKDLRIMIFEINKSENNILDCIIEFSKIDVLNIYSTKKCIYITVEVNKIRNYITDENSPNIANAIKDCINGNIIEDMILLGDMDNDIIKVNFSMVEVLVNNEMALMKKIIHLHEELKKSRTVESDYRIDLSNILYIPLSIKTNKDNVDELMDILNKLGILSIRKINISEDISCVILRESVKSYLRIGKFEPNNFLEKSISKQIKQIFHVYNILI